MKTTSLILAAMLALPVSAFAQGGGTGVPGAEFLAEWDVSGTGSVTLADMQTRRAEIFEMFDLNGDGQIDTPEAENMAQTVAGQQQNNAEAHAGQQRDGNGQGQARGQNQGKGGNGPGRIIHAAMSTEANDTDGNGVITRQEFVDVSEQIFIALDRDNDGALTLADFGR